MLNAQCVHGLIKKDSFCKCFVIVLCWLFGLLLGSYFAFKAADVIRALLISHQPSQIPVLGTVLLILAPYAVTAFLERNRARFLILIIILIKASIYSFCSCAMMIAFEEAGWLAKFLFMFSSSSSCVFLLLFWLEGSCLRSINKRHLYIFLLISLFLVIVDYYVISPFSVVFY